MRRSPLAILCLAALALPAGCNIVGPAYYLIHGPEKTKKLFALDEKKTTVIFIDDRQNRVPRRALRLTMGQEAEKTLLKQKVVKDMVSAESALLAAGTEHRGQPVPISEVGAAVKADIVIYATVDSFGLSPDGESFAPAARLRVKVIDAPSDTRLWPENESGYPLVVKPVLTAKEVPTSLSARYKAEDELAQLTGVELAQLFYNHEALRGPRSPD
jgi:hypothetical protein